MFGWPKLQLLLVLRVQLHSGCNCCSQWLQLTFVVKYATLICKLCKYLHESLHHKTAEANNCSSFKYLLQRLQTKFAALKICNAGCTLDANICSVDQTPMAHDLYTDRPRQLNRPDHNRLAYIEHKWIEKFLNLNSFEQFNCN